MANGARQRKEAKKLVHGWFVTPERPGDRTLAQQLTGLDPLLAEVSGKTVLDVGCAEGLISMECAKRGAKSTFGFDFVEGHVVMADKLKGDLPCRFERHDANEYHPTEQYDIVLMLAILHKLKDPSRCCGRFAVAARDLCVIRLSPTGSKIILDARSNNVPHDIEYVMTKQGFVSERSEVGPLGEMTHYFRRICLP